MSALRFTGLLALFGVLPFTHAGPCHESGLEWKDLHGYDNPDDISGEYAGDISRVCSQLDGVTFAAEGAPHTQCSTWAVTHEDCPDECQSDPSKPYNIPPPSCPTKCDSDAGQSNRINWKITFKGDADAPLDYDTCNDAYLSMTYCTLGGEVESHDFIFTMDPNAGGCPVETRDITKIKRSPLLRADW